VTAPGAPPPGWYADPAGRFEHRWWDGTTWTEAVATRGQQWTDPLVVTSPAQVPAAGDPTVVVASEGDATAVADRGFDETAIALPGGAQPDTIVVNTDVTISGFRNRHVRATLRELQVGSSTIRFDDATAVSYMATRQSVNGVPTNTTYQFELHSLRDKIKLSYSVGSVGRRESKDEKTNVYRGLIAVSAHAIEPRLRGSAVAQIVGGGSVRISSLQLHAGGIFLQAKIGSDKSVTWSDVVGARFAAGSVQVVVRHPSDPTRTKVLATIPMKQLNSVLLPELLPQVQAALQ
jgi:hypothetical protein